MRKALLIALLLAACASLPVEPVVPPQPIAKRPPKIGLVLGGGAARGFAHIGVIQALEEGRFRARVREDFSSGVRSGVNGTPTFFINGVRYDGPVDVESMADALGYVLERAA